jgi:hypothetical protein
MIALVTSCGTKNLKEGSRPSIDNEKSSQMGVIFDGKAVIQFSPDRLN